MATIVSVRCLFLFLSVLSPTLASWDDWWTYDGISGPDFWGLLNPDWHLCTRGRRQSPMDIRPNLLLHDHELGPFHVDRKAVSGLLENNGHSIIFTVHDDSTSGSGARDGGEGSTMSSSEKGSEHGVEPLVNIRGGPLSYEYTFQAVHLHFGRTDEHGSEHTIDGLAFPAELQIIAYNSELYQNFDEASNKANGLAAIALLMQISNSSNIELRVLTNLVHHVRFRGQNVTIKSLTIRELIPDLDFYMTYEGSLTVPGCQETVNWIIVNRPIFITRQQLYSLRKLMQGEASLPKAPLGNNFRPTHPLNHRTVRTNIDFKRTQASDCPTMKKVANYQVNEKHLREGRITSS